MSEQNSPVQLDLFNDTVTTVLVNDAVDALLGRHSDLALACFERLCHAADDYPGRPSLYRLCQALQEWPHAADSIDAIDASRRWLEEAVEPAATAVMPRQTREFMQPFWCDLAEAAERFAYDPALPHACAAELLLRANRPADALRAANAVTDGHGYADVLAWQAQCLYRLKLHDAPRGALFRLALVAPQSFGEVVRRINDVTLNRDWRRFRSSGLWLDLSPESIAEWFPAWFAVECSDSVIPEFRPPLPSTLPANALMAVIALRDLEKRGVGPKLVAARAHLRELDRDLFEHYMSLRGR